MVVVVLLLLNRSFSEEDNSKFIILSLHFFSCLVGSLERNFFTHIYLTFHWHLAIDKNCFAYFIFGIIKDT